MAKEEIYFEEKKGGIHTFTSPRVRFDPLLLRGSGVTGDGLARFVVFVPSVFLCVRRDQGGIICLVGTNDVPDELTIGGIQTKKRSGCFAMGSAKSAGGVSFYSLTCLPTDSPFVGTLWARQEVRVNFLEV